MTEGRCLCGTVRYEIDGPLANMLHCHCSMCRKHHGTPFATWATAPLAVFRFTAGEPAVVRYDSSPGFHRSFCRICGSVAPEGVAAAGLVICPAGNLEGDLGVEPQLHMFVGSKAPWYTITDDLPQFEEYPPQFGMNATSRPQVATEGDHPQGSCLCGAVAYDVAGPPMRMYYCHCSRCRRSRSAAHAANIFYGADGFRWLRGEDLVMNYKPPEAQYFTTAFCRKCGSKMPRVSRERGVVLVPAGTLDNEPGIRPTAHIFVGSKAPWERITDSIPQFDEMPPRP
jgi:hypothetical protein